MIIIKTANGTEFINEGSIKSLSHDKNSAMVVFNHPLEVRHNIVQVESVTYTNKENYEYVDNGLALTAALEDREYYRMLQLSTVEYSKRLYDRRVDLENFILRCEELFTKEYDKNFVESIREDRKERPGTCFQELHQFQEMPYFTNIRKDVDQYGKETTKMFEDMTKTISDLKDMLMRKDRKIHELKKEIGVLSDRIFRLSLRGLWERIINKNF